jgi:hypothetical protein
VQALKRHYDRNSINVSKTSTEQRDFCIKQYFPESIEKNVLITVRINDTVTFVEDGFDEDIEFGDEVSDEGEGDPVDNVSILLIFVSSIDFNIKLIGYPVSIFISW